MTRREAAERTVIRPLELVVPRKSSLSGRTRILRAPTPGVLGRGLRQSSRAAA
jgi:hypothetical protein